MIVVCKQQSCEYNENGRCSQRVLIIDNIFSSENLAGSEFAVCKYWQEERPDYINKYRAYPKEFDPRDKVIIEEGRPAQ